MKYLKIDKNKGYFKIDDNYTEIDKINKDDIFKLISIIINDEENNFEMDEYNEEILNHGVHKIIYSNLYSKFQDLIMDRDRINDTVQQKFADAYQKYSGN